LAPTDATVPAVPVHHWRASHQA